MEESVGKLWHRWITKAASNEYPESAIDLDSLRGKISVWFHALGGEKGVSIKPASLERWSAKRGWLAKIAGTGQQVQLAYFSGDTLYLPGKVAFFSNPELNKNLYFWLVALAAVECQNAAKAEDECSPDNSHWLLRSQRLVEETLECYPGLKNLYAELTMAHLKHRAECHRRSLAFYEQQLLHALRYPGSIQDVLDFPDVREFVPVPLWLHPVPPKEPVSNVSRAEVKTEERSKAEEISGDHRRTARVVEHSKEDEGLLAFRLESLFSWAEFVNVDRPQEDDEELGASTAANDLDEFAVSSSGGTVKQRLKFDLDLPAPQYDEDVVLEGIPLPEWDYKSGELRQARCALNELEAVQVEPEPLPQHLRASATRIRGFFEQLTLSKQWMRKQPQGCEIDWDAYIHSITERKSGAGHSEQGFYREMRRHSRDMSCLLLADLSLSTESAIDDEFSVIDVIRDALLLMSEVLSACGDRYAIAGFSSKNRQLIRYHQIKRFDEKLTNDIRGRIQAIKPGFYTRMGAAIRYATRQLSKEQVEKKLLLLLSDGKPNDLDEYEGRYGIEDTRQAVLEAQAAGIVPFCVTIDQRAHEYLPYLFGRNQYVLIHNARQLPIRLPQIFAQLTEGF